MKRIILISIFLFQLVVSSGQTTDIKLDSASLDILDTALCIQKRVSDFIGKKVSIYELGDSLVNCETNFKNLFYNWSKEFVTNANDYKFIDCSFVDSLSDSTKYNYYRNYFSSGEPLVCRKKGKQTEDSKGQRTVEFYIYPEFKYEYLYDTRGLPKGTKAILSKSFLEKAQTLLNKPFDIDKMQFVHYQSFSYTKDTTIEFGIFNSFGTSESYSNWSIMSPDSLTQDYFDIFIENKKRIDEVDLLEAQSLLLQNIMIQRISEQLFFSQQVKIGDKIYFIKFEYDGKPYSNYVVCSSSTNRVIVDYFFQQIQIHENARKKHLLTR